jgi:hypothetical protein
VLVILGVEQLIKLILGVFHPRLHDYPYLLTLGYHKAVDHDSRLVSRVHAGHAPTGRHPVTVAGSSRAGLGAVHVEGHLTADYAGLASVRVDVDRASGPLVPDGPRGDHRPSSVSNRLGQKARLEHGLRWLIWRDLTVDLVRPLDVWVRLRRSLLLIVGHVDAGSYHAEGYRESQEDVCKPVHSLAPRLYDCPYEVVVAGVLVVPVHPGEPVSVVDVLGRKVLGDLLHRTASQLEEVVVGVDVFLVGVERDVLAVDVHLTYLKGRALE